MSSKRNTTNVHLKRVHSLSFQSNLPHRLTDLSFPFYYKNIHHIVKFSNVPTHQPCPSYITHRTNNLYKSLLYKSHRPNPLQFNLPTTCPPYDILLYPSSNDSVVLQNSSLLDILSLYRFQSVHLFSSAAFKGHPN